MDIASSVQSSATPLGSLLLAVFNSIVEVFILCAGGYILAKQNILDKKTQKQLNRLNVSLFTPALLFSKVAFFLTPEKLKELWIIPIWFIIVTMTSMVIGRVLGWAFNLRRSQKSFVIAASMFMNSNALPIALMQSLVLSVPDLMWGSDDNKNAMLGRALTYLTMYSTLGMVVRYSYGVNLLARADTLQAQPTGDAHERTPLLSQPEVETPRQGSCTTIVGPSDSEESLVCSPQRRPSKYNGSPPPSLSGLPGKMPPIRARSSTRRHPTFYISLPRPDTTGALGHDTAGPSTIDSDSEGADFTDIEEGRLEEDSKDYTPGSRHRLRDLFLSIGDEIKRIWTTFYDFMTVPLWSALLSIIVASVEPLKHALENHLQPLNNTINNAGKCAVPITLVVLGAYFYVPPEEAVKGDVPKRTFAQWTKNALSHSSSDVIPSHGSSAKKDSARPGERKTIFLAVMARMIITPIILTPLLVLATRFDWHAVFDDPVFVVVNIILLSSPPALTLAQITQAVSGDAFERLISGTIFWSYCIVTPPITIISVVVGLILAKL